MKQCVANGSAVVLGQLAGHNEVVHVDVRKVARLLEGAAAADVRDVAGRIHGRLECRSGGSKGRKMVLGPVDVIGVEACVGEVADCFRDCT